MNRLLIIIFFIIFSGSPLFSQVITRSYKTAFDKTAFMGKKQLRPSSHYLTPPAEFKTTQKQRKNPLQFALQKEEQFNLLDPVYGVRQNDSIYYYHEFSSEEASSLSLFFGQFHLAESTHLSIFSDREMTANITHKENNASKVWSSYTYKSNRIYVLARQSALSKQKDELIVTKISYGLDIPSPGASQSCNVDVNCEGSYWDSMKRSVCIITNGTDSFTGALVMNTCGTNKPYILTANHAIANNPGNGEHLSFTFKYWSDFCDSNSPVDVITFSGASHIANYVTTDFALLELKQTPPSNSGLVYAGWTRSDVGITSTAILHHPQGDLMKIAISNSAPAKAVMPVENTISWKAVVSIGATENKSSGAPYFDQNGRVFAQHGGVNLDQSPYTCLQYDKYGGRFHVSWDGDGTSTGRLKDWLDPKGSSVSTTNSTPVNLLIPHHLTITGPDTVCAEGTYTVGTLPAGVTATWTAAPGVTITPQSPDGSTVIVSSSALVSTQLQVTLSGSSCSLTPPTNKRIVIQAFSGASGFKGKFSTQGHSNINLSLTSTLCLKTYPGFPSGAYYGTLKLEDENASSYSWELLSTSHPSAVVYTAMTHLNPQKTEFEVYVRPMNAQAVYRLTVNSSCGSYTKDFIFLANPTNTYPCFIEDILDLMVEVYPNPAQEELNLRLDYKKTESNSMNKSASVKEFNIQKIRITNKLGVKMMEQSFTSVSKERYLPIGQLKPDIYTVSVFDGQRWVSSKFIKK